MYTPSSFPNFSPLLCGPPYFILSPITVFGYDDDHNAGCGPLPSQEHRLGGRAHNPLRASSFPLLDRTWSLYRPLGAMLPGETQMVAAGHLLHVHCIVFVYHWFGVIQAL